MWEAYAAARGGALPSWWAVHLCFCLGWVHRFGRRPSLDDWGRTRPATTLNHLRRLEDDREPSGA
jgi:hypothetical protein